MKKRRKF